MKPNQIKMDISTTRDAASNAQLPFPGHFLREAGGGAVCVQMEVVEAIPTTTTTPPNDTNPSLQEAPQRMPAIGTDFYTSGTRGGKGR